MKEVEELTRAISALEQQRTLLGDRVVEAAQGSLRQQLATLESAELVGRQRRLVSVLFLDIVNSVRMSQGLEPEEVQEVMGGTLKRLSRLVDAYGGQIIQFVGDGFVAVFGLVKTQENDARQAVRAGLAILNEAQICAEELEQHYQLKDFNVRLGVNTGRVVAGRFSEGESPVMGLTVSLASRMEAAAKPGTLYISHFTYQHVRGAFDVRLLPPVKAKGFNQPITVYQIMAARPRTFRTFTRGVEGIETGLIGRAQELSQLKAIYRRTIHRRQAQLVLLSGEAGVGKSRLLYEFDRWLTRSRFRVVAFKGRASPQMMAVPFGMLREMISYRLDFLTTDPVQLTRQRLVERLAAYIDQEPEMKAHFIGSLLGFDFTDSPHLQGVVNDPSQLNERARLYLTQSFAALAGRETTIVMLDDLQWADIPSVDFIAHLVQVCAQLPLLVICLARPTYTERFPAWERNLSRGIATRPEAAAPPITHHILLEPLSRQASLKLLGAILPNVEELPMNLCDHILEGADGNPFYLEEYIQSLLDAGVFRRKRGMQRWSLDHKQLGHLELPNTLVALLEARLDNLDPSERMLVQRASVIGRVFWRSALQAMQGREAISQADLEALTRRGFIFPQDSSTFAGTEEYRFHHALLRDVAYQALVKPDRKVYHSQVAAWFIDATRSSGRTGEFAPVIAEHFETAGKRDQAADWYIQAGQRARNQGAPAQARDFFDRALNLLSPEKHLSATAHDLERRWQALAGRDEVLGILGDTVARMADDVALVELAQQIGDDHHVAEAYFRQGYYLGMSGQYQQEHEAYNRGLQAAVRVQDRSRQALLLGLKVVCEVRLGDLQEATKTAVAALDCAQAVEDELVLARSLINVSTFYTETGDLARAVQLLEQQLAIFHRTGDIQDEVVGLSNLGYNYILLGLPEAGISALQKCIEMSQSIGHRKICAYGSLNLALACLYHGDLTAALKQFETCLPELQAMHDTFGHAVGTTYMALALELNGQVEEALAGFEQAATILEQIGTPGNLHDAKAGAARCLLALNKPDLADSYARVLWDYLRNHAGAGMEFPVLAYETCADIFSARGQPVLARRAIGAGYGELLFRAAKISLSKWRKSFLERVPEHQRIQVRWQKYMEMSRV